MITDVKANCKKSNKSKRKGLVVAMMLMLSVILAVTGIVAAYFSDIYSKNGTGTTGTLKINGTQTYYLNGVEVGATDVGNLSPGDVVVIFGTISNVGTDSAWIREKLDFSGSDEALLPFLKVYDGQHTQSEILGGADLTADEIALSQEGLAVGENKVINGSANVESGGGFVYVNGTSYSYYITIYFDIYAGNEAQNLALNFTVTTQALQFKNNNSAEPTETAWSSVTEA